MAPESPHAISSSWRTSSSSKILLNSHAHLDHAGGHALVKRLTHAQIVMSDADAALLSRGGKGDFPPVTAMATAHSSHNPSRSFSANESMSNGRLRHGQN